MSRIWAYLLIGFVLMTLPKLAYSQKTRYAVESINPDLLKDAHSVIRNYSMEFIVKDLGSANEKLFYAITILDEAARKNAALNIFYDNSIKVKSMSGQLLDKDGNLIRKMKSSEVKDKSAISGFSLYEDNRIKILELTYPQYPYTVIYEYELEKKGLLFYPFWMPQSKNDISVELSELTISVPDDNDLRYVHQGQINDPEIIQEQGIKEYKWSVKDLTAFDIEPFSPDFESLVPSVRTAPRKFEMGGYVGNMESWDELGKWQGSLNKGLNNLPDHIVKEVEALTTNVSDTLEKVKLIYKYLQETTRYVSIQLGIGGWQPFDANYVAENGYGDCKALTNYTYSLLESIGVTGYYTLIRAGKYEPNINTTFPSRQFNHVILTVPLASDTVWLECTSQTNPFGYTGYFTGNRSALMITENGGKIIQTPGFSTNENIQIRNAEIQVNTNGEAVIKTQTRYKGIQYENVSSQTRRSFDDQKDWLYKNITLTDFEIQAFEYDEVSETLPSIFEKLEIKVDNLTSKTGKRMFIVPNVFNRINTWPKEVSNRQSPVMTRFPFTDIDSIHINIPHNMHIEVLPEDISLESIFGEYHTKYEIDQDRIIYIRKLIWKDGIFPAESYTELVDFLKKVAKNDSSKIVLINST